MIYGSFDLVTGEQLSVNVSSIDFDISGIPELATIPTGENIYYLDNGTVTARQTLALTADSTVEADGVDEAVITGLPNPTEVTWPDGAVTTVTDGEVRFSVDLEGFYDFKFDSIPHIIEDITIEAVTPI